MSLIRVLPRSYVLALAGLAVLSALQDALEKSFGSTLRFAALIAFGVSATPFSIAGITSAFWASECRKAMPFGIAAPVAPALKVS